MSWRGAKACPASPQAIKGAMTCAQVKPAHVARILGLPLPHVLLVLAGRAHFSFDQLARLKEYLAHEMREKGLLAKLREEQERQASDPRGLAEQFHRPKVHLRSVPSEKPGGTWFRAPWCDAPTSGGILDLALGGAPEYIYVVPMDEFESAAAHLEASGYNVVNGDAPEGWFDVSEPVVIDTGGL